MNTKKAEHTPGPWRVGENTQYVIAGKDSITRTHSVVRGEAVAEANARLIAAAPEMLEALKICALALENTWETSDEAKMARAAILKAEGK